MGEKIYLANGKKFGQYETISLQVEIDKMFKYLAEQNKTDKGKLKTAFDILKEQTKNIPGFAQFTRNDGKTGLALKIDINEKREHGEFNGTLNTWVKGNESPKEVKKNDIDTEQSDDLPF